MSAPDEAAEVVTEAEFMDAFANLLQGTIKFALDQRNLELYTLAIERRDDEMFSMLEELETAQSLDFANKVLAHQEAISNRGDRYHAAVQSAFLGEQLAGICEHLAKVKHYCAQANIASTSLTMEDIMRRQTGS